MPGLCAAGGCELIAGAAIYVGVKLSEFAWRPALSAVSHALEPFAGLGPGTFGVPGALVGGGARLYAQAVREAAGSEILMAQGISTSQLVGDALSSARAARDSVVMDVRAAREVDQIATVTGAVNVRTGDIAVGKSYSNICAEQFCARGLGAATEDIRFTDAVRPRTLNDVQICTTCEAQWGRGAFPAEARFQSDGGLDKMQSPTFAQTNWGVFDNFQVFGGFWD